ncbi:hypothetical protein WICPIJ_003033 [Wickerhamomyces pijperi]|uniref:USP domain-containing protein n=1 Tax=Wickerhamomyces pijperi TaxID=599730 RepID=A0A9P8Q843_WICPI|nr:hypothetical protein WICPIJ_003033 [Wickerhamomyces pijperi]
MGGWSEVTRAQVVRPNDLNLNAVQPTCCVFDKQSDLVWVGDSSGSVASYADTSLTPYTRFTAHKDPVIQLLPYDKGIVSIDSHGIRLTSQRGLVSYHVSSTSCPEMEGLDSIAYIFKNEILMSSQSSLIEFDLDKGRVLNIIPHNKAVMIMRSNRNYIAVGNTDGTIDIYNPKTKSIIKTFHSNMGTLSDLDMNKDTLISCGYSLRHGNYALDPFVNVYDLRTLAPLNPISFPAGAMFVRLHPRLSSSALISSKNGQIQVVDVYNISNVQLYHVDARPIVTGFELSSTGDYICIMDNFSIHLWCQNPESSQMSDRRALEYPSSEEYPGYVDIGDEDYALNQVGMPYYKEQLLSAWSYQATFNSRGTIPKAIDPLLVMNATPNASGILEGKYDASRFGHRNQAKKYINLTAQVSSRFLSAKNNSKNSPLKKNSNSNGKIGIDSMKPDESIFDTKNGTPPNAFKKLRIQYSRFGVDDFDFDSYNLTALSGLESHVDNSYSNCLLQLYSHIPEFYSFVISKLAKQDFTPGSMLRETGYLFDMLNKSHGHHFRPGKFQSNFSNMRESNDAGLVQRETDPSISPLDEIPRLHAYHRFLLDKIAYDELKQGPLPTKGKKILVDELFIIETEVVKRTMTGMQNAVDSQRILEVYPPQKPLYFTSQNRSILKFIEGALNHTELIRDSSIPYERTTMARHLPPILAINLHLGPDELKQIRETADWLRPNFFTARTNSGYVLIDSLRHQDQNSEFYQKYSLLGYVAEIKDQETQKTHFVTFAQCYDAANNCMNWYLFNDFLVMPIAEEEALNVKHHWKTPVSLVYRLAVNGPGTFRTDAWRFGLEDEILYRDFFARGTREGKIIEYELLTREEAPQPGSLVAIDAEFVTLEQELFEYRSNGTKLLIKPKRQTLARVSVIRGDPKSPNHGVPFIDDYVVVRENIKDYLTSYSGIEEGDLNPQTSNKPLVELDIVYRKLWLLLNIGCVFIGHGLTNDFRTINIAVPKAQVKDTAVFFHKGQRILSLRFLAYSLLGKRVQTGNHDSIEDALTALNIYEQYLILKQHGNFEETLDMIYRQGQFLNFKPPEDDD